MKPVPLSGGWSHGTKLPTVAGNLVIATMRTIPLTPSRVSELEAMARRSALLRASVALAERATKTTWQARYMANTESGADKLMRRACRQQRAAFRLQKWAGVLP